MLKICSFLFLSMLCLVGCGASQCRPVIDLSYEEMSTDSQYALAVEIRRAEASCTTAAPLFERIRRDHPYSRYFLLAEVDLAHCAELDGRPEEAITRFEAFIERNPLHPRAHHARLQVLRIQEDLEAVASAR